LRKILLNVLLLVIFLVSFSIFADPISMFWSFLADVDEDGSAFENCSL